METAIELLDELEDVYRGGGWVPGMYMEPDANVECGARGCLIGMATLCESMANDIRPANVWPSLNHGSAQTHRARYCTLNRTGLQEARELFPLSAEVIAAMCEDPVCKLYAEQQIPVEFRTAEWWNDHRVYDFLDEGLNASAAKEAALQEVFDLIARTRARLQEFQQETPEPQEPEENDGEDQPETEPAAGERVPA